MVNKTLLYRIWHTLFPLRESLSRFRLWDKVILGKGSRCNGTAFEGMNTLMAVSYTHLTLPTTPYV